LRFGETQFLVHKFLLSNKSHKISSRLFLILIFLSIVPHILSVGFLFFLGHFHSIPTHQHTNTHTHSSHLHCVFLILFFLCLSSFLQCSSQQLSEGSHTYFHVFLINSCMNIQCNTQCIRQQVSDASPKYVHLFLIDTCMNIQCTCQSVELGTD